MLALITFGSYISTPCPIINNPSALNAFTERIIEPRFP